MPGGDERIVRFIREASWGSFPDAVCEKARMCALDLVGALAAGTKAKVSGIMAGAALACFPGDDATLILNGKRASMPGAALANGFAMNALDVDDGHRLIKGHPGAAVFPALLAAAEYRDATLRELLETLVVCYEVAIRAGLAMQSHYGYYHGSGAWGAVGAAAGVARLLGLDGPRTLHALGAAEYHAPLTPVMRPVQFPTMNKDGIGWGNMVGVLSALMAAEGYTGSPTVFDLPDFDSFTETLGDEYKIMELYFKPYACCRWAHPAVSAALELRERHALCPADIESVRILSFGAAASLYTKKPANTEEAQYNAIYPVAAAIAAGEVGPRQVLDEYLGDAGTLGLMDRITIQPDERFEREFPARRLCEVEVVLKDGRVLRSGVHGPAGEPEDNVGMEWIRNKFFWLTADVLDKPRAEAVATLLAGNIAAIRTSEFIGMFKGLSH